MKRHAEKTIRKDANKVQFGTDNKTTEHRLECNAIFDVKESGGLFKIDDVI